MKLKNFLFILIFTLISSCNGVGTASFKEAAQGTGGEEQSGESGTDSSLVFAGISSVSNKNDTSLTLNWTVNPDAIAYDVFDTTSGSVTLINSAFGQSQNSISMSALTPGSTYKFRVRIKNSSGLYDTNTNDFSVTMNSAPDVPSSLSLLTPSVSAGTLATPAIRVSGVKSGDTVKIFSDSLCSTERGSAVASGTTVDITSSSLISGSHSFYASSTNTSNTSSSCSTENVSYLLCPSGYVPVRGSAALGVNDFCVAQFEMKNVSEVATSQAAGTPWVGITQTNAKTACTSLGAGYDLISNPEWLNIAHEIEKNAGNWSSGVPGTGMLNRGHSDAAPNNAVAVSDTNNPYTETSNNSGQAAGSGWEQKRSHTLSDGHVMWDFAGNVWEWTDWSLGGGLNPGPKDCIGGVWTQLPSVSCGSLSAADYMPLNPGAVTATNYNSNYGLGQFWGGAGGAAIRGGQWNSLVNAGLFAIRLSYGNSASNTMIGFRCVIRHEVLN